MDSRPTSALRSQPSSLPPRSRRLRSAPAISGHELRELRRALNLNQEELADRLLVSKAYVQKLESSPGSVPPLICERVVSLQRSLASRAAVPIQSPRRFHDFRRSTKFSKVPLFTATPACPCLNVGCNLTPIRDGDWPDGEHWWKFQGIRCRKIRYVIVGSNSRARIVEPPLRYAGDGVPREVCSKCGRARALGKKFSSRLDRDVFTRYCRRQKGDARDLQHDLPTHFLQRGSRFVPVPDEEREKLHGRSRREFPVPKCEVAACPRHGRTMERSTVLRLKRTDGAPAQIAAYRCRPHSPSKPHAAYRVLPQGKIAERRGFGHYKWIGENGQTIQTAPLRRRTRPGSAPGKRAALFAEAERLHKTGLFWSQIARELIPDEFRVNPKAAAQRLRKGVRYYQKIARLA